MGAGWPVTKVTLANNSNGSPLHVWHPEKIITKDADNATEQKENRISDLKSGRSPYRGWKTVWTPKLIWEDDKSANETRKVNKADWEQEKTKNKTGSGVTGGEDGSAYNGEMSSQTPKMPNPFYVDEKPLKLKELR